MNCILLNNEFNLKEPLVIKYHGKTKKKEKKKFHQTRGFILGILRWLLHLDLERSEATTRQTDVLQRFDFYQTIKEFSCRS